jgi:hypothetical protein
MRQSAKDVDSGKALKLYASRSRDILIVMKSLSNIILGKCVNSPLIDIKLMGVLSWQGNVLL